MNPDVKAKWVEALRSDDYQQGRGLLVIGPPGKVTWCCLGVLCDLAVQSGDVPLVRNGMFFEDPNTAERTEGGMPLASVYEWAGLSEEDATQLADLNDSDDAGFGAIAFVIEAWL